MNITLRKLAMIEKDFAEREEQAKVSGFASCPIDRDLQSRITSLLDKVRSL